MSKLTVKALAKLEAEFKEAAIAFSDAESDASKSRAKKRQQPSDSLRIAEAQARFEDLQQLAIRYVAVLVTGEDASDWGGTVGATERWLKQLRSNGCAFVAAFELVIAKPYDAVFKNAEASAKRAK